MRVSLCLLVWNELEGCRSDVPLLPREALEEIYAIDGGSSDGTVSYLESQNIPVYPQPEKGLNAAYIHAVEKSTCDAVVVFLPKGTTPPEDTRKFRVFFESG
jgi:glycosyltransferase involved in cell wall biosynthesis